MIARAYPPLRDKPVNSTYLPVRVAAIRRVKPRNARLEPDGRPVDQKNTVTMPNAISVTAPSITNRSSITSPGGEGDMVAFTARAHPASPIHNRTLRSASIGCLGKRGDRPVSPHARCQADGSARSPESWRQETMIVAIHRAMAYGPLKLGNPQPTEFDARRSVGSRTDHADATKRRRVNDLRAPVEQTLARTSRTTVRCAGARCLARSTRTIRAARSTRGSNRSCER
jgi:hypothetical protein